MATIIEQFSTSKSGHDHDNEDWLHVSDNFIAIIDGATSKSAPKIGDETTGRAIARITNEALHTTKSLQAADVLRDINRAIVSQLAPAIPDDPMAERPTASMIVYSKALGEIWVLGDCLLQVDDAVHDFSKLIDKVNADWRSAYIRAEIAVGNITNSIATADPARALILPLLQRQYAFQNNPAAGDLAFGALDGREAAIPFIKIVKPARGQTIVMASDGYPALRPTLAEAEAYLADVNRNDPMQITLHPCAKGIAPDNQSFDDRTYVRFTI